MAVETADVVVIGTGFGGLPRIYPTSDSISLSTPDQWIEAGSVANFVISWGVIGPWYLPLFVRELGGVDVDYIVLRTTIEDALERVAVRNAPEMEDIVRKMHEPFLDLRVHTPVYTTDALHQANRVPVNVVVDHPGGVLKVQAF